MLHAYTFEKSASFHLKLRRGLMLQDVNKCYLFHSIISYHILSNSWWGQLVITQPVSSNLDPTHLINIKLNDVFMTPKFIQKH